MSEPSAELASPPHSGHSRPSTTAGAPECSGHVRRRVVFVTDIVTPYMVAVLEALGDICDLVVLFCSQTGTRGMGWQVDISFRHEIIEGTTIRRRSPDATDYYLSPRILGAILRNRPQAIIVGGFSIPSLYGAICGHLRGAPLLIHSDGTRRSEAHLGLHNRVSRRVLRRAAWGAIANSRPAADRFADIGFPLERIFTAPHVTRMSPFWEVARQRSWSDRADLRLLYVGRLIARKGLDLLLRSCIQARDAGVDVQLTVVGSGAEEAALRRLADSHRLRVDWKGFVDQAGLPGVYAQADAFAFPTLDDPFGIVVLEAAAAGLPLIASPHGGATEDFVQDGMNGFVVEPTDVDAMAAAIRKLAHQPQLRARMGRAAHAATLGRSPAITASAYLRAVEAALATA